MFRTVDIIMIGALIAGAAWTFKVKYDSEIAVARVARLEKQLQLEREAIDILKADWSLLTSPERLEKLVERYREELQLETVAPQQVGTLDEIPERSAATDPATEDFAAGGAPDRSAVTGAIGKATSAAGE